MLVDSFETGNFVVTVVNPQASEPVDLPLATVRTASIPTRNLSEGAAIISTVRTDTGQLIFGLNGHSTSLNPFVFLDLTLGYLSSGSQSFAGNTGIQFDFARMLGGGTIHVHLGTDQGIYGEAAFRLPVSGPGKYFYPSDQLSLDPGESTEHFTRMYFLFEPRTEEFSFALNDIWLVPEPSSMLLGLTAAAGLIIRRRRKS